MKRKENISFNTNYIYIYDCVNIKDCLCVYIFIRMNIICKTTNPDSQYICYAKFQIYSSNHLNVCAYRIQILSNNLITRNIFYS